MTNNIRLVFRPEIAHNLGLNKSSRKLDCSFEPGESLGDVLGRLSDENPNIAKRIYDRDNRLVNNLVQMSINGQLLSLTGGLEAPLTNGDEVLIFYAAGGG